MKPEKKAKPEGKAKRKKLQISAKTKERVKACKAYIEGKSY